MTAETVSDCPYTKVFELLGPVESGHLTTYHNKRHEILRSSIDSGNVSGIRLGGTRELGFYLIRPYLPGGYIRKDLQRLSWGTEGQEQGTIAVCLDATHGRQVTNVAELGEQDLADVLKSAKRIHESWITHRKLGLTIIFEK